MSKTTSDIFMVMVICVPMLAVAHLNTEDSTLNVVSLSTPMSSILVPVTKGTRHEKHSDCYKNIQTSTGNASSPGHPKQYPPNVYCTWVITVPEGQRVRLKFMTFDLPNMTNEGCLHGFLGYGSYDPEDSSAMKSLFRCGNQKIPEYISPDNRCWVMFISGPIHHVNETYSGFFIKFDSMPAENTGNRNSSLLFTLLLVLLPLMSILLVCLYRYKKRYQYSTKYQENREQQAADRFRRKHIRRATTRRFSQSQRFKIQVQRASEDNDEDTSQIASFPTAKKISIHSGEYCVIPDKANGYNVHREIKPSYQGKRCSEASCGSVFLHENTPWHTPRRYPVTTSSGPFLNLPIPDHSSKNRIASYMSLEHATGIPSQLRHFSNDNRLSGNKQVPVIQLYQPNEDAMSSRSGIMKAPQGPRQHMNSRFISADSDIMVDARNRSSILSASAVYNIEAQRQEGDKRNTPKRRETMYASRTDRENQYLCFNDDANSIGTEVFYSARKEPFRSKSDAQTMMNRRYSERGNHDNLPPLSFVQSVNRLPVLCHLNSECPSNMASDDPLRNSLVRTRHISVSQNSMQAYMMDEMDNNFEQNQKKNKFMALDIQSLMVVQNQMAVNQSMKSDKIYHHGNNRSLNYSVSSRLNNTTQKMDQQNGTHHSKSDSHLQYQPLLERNFTSQRDLEAVNPIFEISHTGKQGRNKNQKLNQHEDWIQGSFISNKSRNNTTCYIDENNNSYLEDSLCVREVEDDGSIVYDQVVVLEPGESMV